MRNPILPRFFKLCLILLPLLFATIYVQQSDAYDVLASGNTHEHEGYSELVLGARPPELAFNGPLFTSPLLTPDNKWGVWSRSVDPMPLVMVHMTMLRDGRILTWDREDTITGTMQYYLMDQRSGARTSIPGPSVFCAGHMLLQDGRVLLAGGHKRYDYYGIKDTYIYDPTSETWSQSGDMTQERWYPTFIELDDGRIVTLGGSIDGVGPIPRLYADLPEVFSLSTNTWTPLNAATRGVGLYPRTFLMPTGNRIFTISEMFLENTVRSAILNVDTQSWTTVSDHLPSTHGAYPSAAMYRPGKVIYTAARDTYIIDLNQPSPAWLKTASMAYSRYDHNLVILPDGNVLAVGGSSNGSDDTGTGILAAEMWNPNTQTWNPLASMAHERMYHSVAFLLPDGSVYVAGGGRAPSKKDYLTGQRYYPPYFFKTPRPIISNLGYGRGNTLAVTTPNASAISSVVLIGLPSVTHAMNISQSYTTLSFTREAGYVIAQVPSTSNNNYLQPGTYMLFIVDNMGIPSTSRFVQIR